VTVSWTTDTLVSQVRRRAAVPDTGTPTAQEILDVATEEIRTRFVPFIREQREAFGLKTTTRTLTVGTADYRIPSDASGGAIHSLVYVKSDGTERNLVRLTVQDDREWSTNGTVRGYELIDGKVRLYPAPDTADTLRILYFRRPSALVPVSSCFPVASKTSTTVVVTGTPSWTSGTPIDVVQYLPHFDQVVDDNAATRSTSTFTLASSAPTTDIVAGDYVCLHMETCIPGIPAELHAALVSATAAQILVEEGDAQGAAMETANAQRIMDAARATLSPRADGSPRFLIPRNSPTRSRYRRTAGWDVSR
jgi:hypothetical protein